MATSTDDPLIGRTIKGFRIESCLGAGGMGAVYLARDEKLARPVALKVMRPELCADPSFVARFEREAKAAAVLTHPSVITVYGYGTTDEGLTYMALEFVEGRELGRLIKEAPRGLPPARIGFLLSQVLAGLEAAHAKNIVHRDLKPANIMVEGSGRDQRARILDFGIAKLRDGGEQLTAAGTVIGTAAYMAPEQAQGKEVDHRADLYAVGVILFQLLSGRLPYSGGTVFDVLEKHVNGPIPSLERPDLLAYDPVVRRALAKDPAARYPDAAAFRSAIEATLLPGAPASGVHPSSLAVPSSPDAFAETSVMDAPGSGYGQASGSGYGRAPDTHAHNSHPGGGHFTGRGAPTQAALPPASGVGPTPAGPYRAGQTRDFFKGLVGRRIGKLTIEEQLGAGGMGAVFRARNEILGRAVAVKVVHPALAHRGDVQRRFLREAQAAFDFVHTNAIATRDCDVTPEGLLYIVQDYSPGESLRAILAREGRLSLGRALGITRQVLAALSEAHARGIVHRDLKPSNVMVEANEGGDDWVRVCDFGLAKLLDPDAGEESITGIGEAIGTPHYMAPEQTEGDVDARTDLYAMGCVLYELLTGSRPFRSDSMRSLLFMHMSRPPEPPTERAPDAKIPPKVEEIVLRALAKEPDDRYPSAADMIAAIDVAGVELPTRRGSTRITPPALDSDADTIVPAPPRKSGSKLPFVLGVCLLGGLALAFGLKQVRERSLARQVPTPQPTASVAVTPSSPTPTVAPPQTPPPATPTPTATPDEEAARKAAEEEAKRKAAAEEAKRLAAAEEEAKRKAAEEEAKRLAAAEEEAKQKAAAEQEAKRKAAEEEAKRKAAEEEAKRKAAEEEAKRKAAEEEAQHKAAAEAEAKRKAAEEEAKRKAAEEEAKRKAAEEEAKRKADEEAKRKADEEAKLLAEKIKSPWTRTKEGWAFTRKRSRVLFLSVPEATVDDDAGGTVKVRDLWVSSRPVTYALVARYAETLPTARKRQVTRAALAKVLDRRRPKGPLVRRVAKAWRGEAATLPLWVARDLANWAGLRLPSEHEALAIALGRPEFAKRPLLSAEGAAIVREPAHARVVRQSVDQLRTHVYFVGQPPRGE